MNCRTLLTLIATLACTGIGSAQDSFATVFQQANQKMVKIFGSGGYQGLVNYGSGIVISPEGHILTVAAQLLDTADLRVHLADGRRMKAKVVVIEPELDSAIIQLVSEGKTALVLDLPFYDVPASAKQMNIKPSDMVYTLNNSYQVAMRDEAMTVQRAMIASISKLQARKGIFEAPYHGEVIFLDAVTNNPGSAGGALVTRDGKLIGMIGKESRNTASDTWANYAIPLNSKIEVKIDDKPRTIAFAEFVELGIQGKWKPTPPREKRAGLGAYHGITFVPNVVEQTPPYVESVEPNSPAARAALKPDDLIVYFEGEPVYSIKLFREMILKSEPGMKVRLEVRRGEKLMPVELELTTMPKK